LKFEGYFIYTEQVRELFEVFMRIGVANLSWLMFAEPAKYVFSMEKETKRYIALTHRTQGSIYQKWFGKECMISLKTPFC
jgi:hypothetical protein